jgi:hypothetical protein
MIGVVSRVMPNSFCVGEPENQCRLTATIGDVVLKVSRRWINLLLQPLNRFLGGQCVHRSFQTGDNQRPIIDKPERVFWPYGLM